MTSFHLAEIHFVKVANGDVHVQFNVTIHDTNSQLLGLLWHHYLVMVVIWELLSYQQI